MTKLLLASLTSATVLLAACDFGSTKDDIDADRSDELTSNSVTQLFAGSDDFSAMQGELLLATQLDPNNVEARVFLGGVSLLQVAKQKMAQGQGGRRELERSGIRVIDGQTFWDMEFELEDHGQGMFKDDIPTLDEFVSRLHGDVLPALDALALALRTVPENWEYVVPADRAGLLLQLLSPGGNHPIRFDYADVQIGLAVVDGVRAAVESTAILDFDGLSLDEFDIVDDPNLDPLGVLVDDHPSFGTLLRLQNLLRARDRLRDGFAAYDRGMNRLRNENQQQQHEGVLSLARLGLLVSDPQQQQEIFAIEQQLRDWLRPMVDAMNGGRYTIATELDGTPLPASEQITIDFGAFLAGVDPRATYLKTVVDPFTGLLTLGVSDLSELTPAMASFGGTVASIGGDAPDPAALQEIPGYALRRELGQMPVSTKTIDGSFGDWAQDRELVMLSAASFPLETRPEIGELFVARDATDLYVHLDEDLTQYLVASGDVYDIVVEWDSGAVAGVECVMGSHSTLGSATFAHVPGGDGGIECAFQIDGDWASIVVAIGGDNSSWEFESNRGPVFVQVR